MIPSDWLELTVAAIAFALSALAALVLRLGVHRRMLLAALRGIAQLLVVGLCLRYVLQRAPSALGLAVAAAMIALAAREIGARSRSPAYLGVAPMTGVAAMIVAVAMITRGAAWYRPAQLVPLTGFVLGTSMNAASASLHHWLSRLDHERSALEAQLALGIRARQALAPLKRDALQAGLLPSLNQLATAGIISLPGVMTGQILAGVDALSAARTQVALLLVLGASAFIAAHGVSVALLRHVVDDRDRLRLDRLRARQTLRWRR